VKPRKSCILIFALVALIFLARTVFAGGSGLNVVVVVNQNSTNSVELGNYYCEQRQIEPQNVVRINWTGGNTVWDKTNLEATLLAPMQAAISSRGLTNQIDFIMLSMDIPFAVSSTNGYNSTTAMIYYGFKPDGCSISCPGGIASCNLPLPATNTYAAQEDIFRNVGPGSSRTNIMAIMLTSDSLAHAKAIVDHGVMSDFTFPTQTVLLAKSTDTARNIRYQEFDNTVFNARLRGNYAMARTNNSDTPLGLTNLLGYENGLYQFTISPNTFVPGAMADSLTSFGGVIFGPNDHTIALVFLNAGAAGSYGTVVEPCAYLEKFPSSQNYFYQSRGFNIAECYYQSLAYPYEGILLGEPLAAPFAQPANGAWINLTNNQVLHGTTNLSLQFIAADHTRPLGQVDLFLDGIWLQTLTNLPPRQANILYVTANGAKTNYMIPASATIKTVASNLMMTLNHAYFTNAAKVQAFHFGDRVELRSFDVNTPGAQVSLSVSNTIGTATDLHTVISAARTNFIDSIAWGYRSYLISGAVVSNDILQITTTKTNGAIVTVAVTNLITGTTLTSFAQRLIDGVNTNASLQGNDGLVAEDLVTDTSTIIEFNLRARGTGINAAQIQANLSGSFTIQPTGTLRLNQNLSDLQPRNHIYIASGMTNLAVSFPFNTTAQADGYHELTAVAYEGTHVRTQKRLAQTVQIHNTILSATFVSLLGGTNTAVEATLQFSVTANTNSSAVSKIELFSTGGLLATVTGQSNAVFSVAGTNLDLGLHGFYAIMTLNNGQQYRTDTKWIRLVGASPAFSLTLTNPPPTITWPAVAGRPYQILSATNITETFQLRGSVTPTNSLGSWTEPNAAPRQFYRISAAE